MKNLILFDQDTQHYRQSIYRGFKKEFEKIGYNLVVVYDLKNNTMDDQEGLFIGIDYSLKNFIKILKQYKCKLIIQFVWLKYRFIFPFMFYCKLKGVKSIVWSHGINLQEKDQLIMNQMYYLRQRLASALIIYSENERKYIRASHKKLFIANNTLNFDEFPQIPESKEQLKEKYGFAGRKVILTVARFNVMNRKFFYIPATYRILNDKEYIWLVSGPGLSDQDKALIENNKNIIYYGPIYDPVNMNEIYKLSDIFVMPGGLGLAINQAFYHGLPIIVENVEHSPEVVYLKEGQNGFFFKEGNLSDLADKIRAIFDNPQTLESLSKKAIEVMNTEGSFEQMVDNFVKAIQYTQKK
jgi:glycosyltransferase involved in cell wall biosynthesis